MYKVACVALATIACAGALAAPATAAAPSHAVQQISEITKARLGYTLREAVELARAGGRSFEVSAASTGERRMTTLACETEACVRSCLAPVDKFSNNECLGTGPNLVDNLLSGNGESPFDGLDDVFPNFDNVTEDSTAQFDKFCSCGADISGFFRAIFRAVSCVGFEIDDSDGGSPFNPDDFGDIIAAAFRFICINNGEEYCFIKFETQTILDVDDEDGFQSASNASKCAFLEDTGCCVPSFIAEIQKPELQTLFEDDGGSNSTLTIIGQMQAELERCGFGGVEPCLGPGESAVYAQAQTRIMADFNVLANDAAKREAFKLAFKRDVADALPNVTPPQVEVTGIRNGSVIVDFRVRGEGQKAALDSALQTGIPLTNVRSDVSEFSSVSDVTASDTTTTEATIENEADPSSAAVAVPSLLLAALAALFVTLL